MDAYFPGKMAGFLRSYCLNQPGAYETGPEFRVWQKPDGSWGGQATWMMWCPGADTTVGQTSRRAFGEGATPEEAFASVVSAAAVVAGTTDG